MIKTISELTTEQGVQVRLKELENFYYVETETETNIHRTHNYTSLEEASQRFEEVSKSFS